MTQKSLILEYIREHGSILPAKMAGFVFKDQMMGSETSKRCREMRKAGILRSEPDGKFERFLLNDINVYRGGYYPQPLPSTLAFLEKYKKQEQPQRSLFN